ncbi:TPA: DHH family phosphoesterase, partial [Candidatus Micrarchaeota archaeon]|nr:DHH family phosphoesterase [Candidatus Micrarchaeota archaeon]
FPKRPKNETYEANEFSTVLNACGRHGRVDVGLRVCMGDESAYAEGRALLQQHRRMLKQGIEFALGKVQDLGRFYFLDGRGVVDEGIIGIVCGMVLRQSWTKPMIGISLGENDTVKVSGRAPRPLVEAGMNLGEMMKTAASEVGGIGGGHRIAAGASIPKDSVNEFLLAAGHYFRLIT